MADSSEHQNDDGKKGVGTTASSSSDESSSSDDSSDASSNDRGSAPTLPRGKNLAFQSRLGQGKQLRSVFPTADD
jgi:hypothetical protein